MGEPPAASGTKPPPIPRWAKVFGAVAVLVVLVFVVLLLTGGHRPRRHGLDGSTVLSAATPASHTQAAGPS